MKSTRMRSAHTRTFPQDGSREVEGWPDKGLWKADGHCLRTQTSDLLRQVTG